MTDSAFADDWRAENEVHPAADLFPMMSDAELDELADDIAKHGLQQPIVWLKGQLLDGRNRVDAIHRISDKQRQQEIVRDLQNGKHTKNLLTHPDPVGYVISANMHRRHLTAEQKREVIAKVLRERPGDSDRAIGRMVQADHKTVAAVRADAEAGGEIPHHETRLGADGVLQPARKPRPDPAAQRGQPLRDGPDFWPTPQSLISALVHFVLPGLPKGAIWECACGDGRMAKAIAKAGHKVFTSDLYSQDGKVWHDFLKDDPPKPDTIAVTNPPFNLNEEFLRRGLELLDAGRIKGLVLLLRHDHLMAGSRTQALNRAAWEVHCNWRPTWIEDSDGNPRWSFHWLAWHDGLRHPPLYLSLSDIEILAYRDAGVLVPRSEATQPFRPGSRAPSGGLIDSKPRNSRGADVPPDALQATPGPS